MRGFQKYARNWIVTMAFWAACKIAQPIQPIWQHIFALSWSAHKSHCENSISSIFLKSPHQVDLNYVGQCWKDFLYYFTTLETYHYSCVFGHIASISSSFWSSILTEELHGPMSNAVSICTKILKYRVWKIEFDELGFLSISNSNFAGYTGSKNLVQTR